MQCPAELPIVGFEEWKTAATVHLKVCAFHFFSSDSPKACQNKNFNKKNCNIYSKLLYFLGLLLRVQLPVRVTKDIVETYQLCNPSFRHSEKLNPKRYLTNPSVPEFNNGCDNGNHDLILYYGCVLVNENGTRR